MFHVVLPDALFSCFESFFSIISIGEERADLDASPAFECLLRFALFSFSPGVGVWMRIMTEALPDFSFNFLRVVYILWFHVLYCD